MEEALEECYKQLGDNASFLYETCRGAASSSTWHRKCYNKWMKVSGAQWDYIDKNNFYGWEFQSAIVETEGIHVTELITRAKTMLYVLLVSSDYEDVDDVESDYFKCKGYFQQAVEQGLVKMK